MPLDSPACLRHAACIWTLLTVFGAGAPSAHASKLVGVQPVDQDYLMVYFKDGEVWYRDDGTGPSAFQGHDLAPGDDRLEAFGEELDVVVAAVPNNWKLTSPDDPHYAGAGLSPSAVHRKAKVNNTDQAWNFKLDHWFFLRLPHALRQGSRYTLHVDPRTHTDVVATDLTYDVYHSLSEAVHVNIIGYTPQSPVKSADLYLWLGDGGPRDYRSFEGNQVWLYDVASGHKHDVGRVTFWKPSRREAEGRNLTGSPVWNVDFSTFTQPGTYRLAVDGVGCSQDFQIRDDVYFEPFKTAVRGYYYMRIGEDRMDLTPVPRRPLFIPGKDPPGFTVYLTDLHPYHPAWRSHRGDTWDEPHFKPAAESLFWRHRLPGNPTNPNAFGGRSDALDWDRHLGHVSDIYDLLFPYLLTQGTLGEDNLDIAESGNGIPDLIDEARNEVDFWLRLRDGDAYAHGLTNPSKEKTVMFQAGTTTMAAWANAANCAMLADAFRVAGHAELMAYYRDEAVRAYRFASNQAEQQLDDRQEVGDAEMRGRDFRMMAAAFLYNVTGDIVWEDAMAADSVVSAGRAEIDSRRRWNQTWGTAAYLFSPHDQHYPQLVENMKDSVIQQAEENNVRHMTERPSRRASNNNWWQTSQNLQMVVLAHAITDDTSQRERFLQSMTLEADWGLGRNPGNLVEMTGLGQRHIVNCYTSGRNDGTPGLHPGHTPYNNLEPWGREPQGSNPRWFTDRGYPEWEAGGWPYQEAHFNCRYSWANGEFTPRQTMRGKLVLYAYLYALGRPHGQ